MRNRIRKNGITALVTIAILATLTALGAAAYLVHEGLLFAPLSPQK